MGLPDLADRDSLRPLAHAGDLSGLAARPERAARDRPEDPDPLRNPFQRDRDRILRSRSFRRLKHKTQVFVAPRGDHYRTRLTHTLEVSALARTVARALGLDEDLTEAIALGHDLGHAPFGHAGEEALDRASRARGGPGFLHNVQGRRVVEVLERDGAGLNLTFETRDGIEHHTGEGWPATLEAELVRVVDRIAYVNHDIEDAIRAGVITDRDLPRPEIELLGAGGGARLRCLTGDLVLTSTAAGRVILSDEVGAAFMRLREFMFERVYLVPPASDEAERGRRVVRELVDWYLADPDRLPPGPGDDATTRVIDFVSGMTDRYAIAAFEDALMPRRDRS